MSTLFLLGVEIAQFLVLDIPGFLELKVELTTAFEKAWKWILSAVRRC